MVRVLHHQSAVEVGLAGDKDLVALLQAFDQPWLVEPNHAQRRPGIVAQDGLRQRHPLVLGLVGADLVDPSTNRRLHSRTHECDRRDGGKILVAAREEEQEIADGRDAEPAQFGLRLIADAREGRDRIIEGRVPHHLQPRHGQATR